MKVCIKGNEFNTNYHKVFGEEKAILDGYTIVEVSQGYEDCAFEDFDNNGFNVDLYNQRKQNHLKQFESDKKLVKLKTWFNTTYRYKDEKYNRLIILGKLDDDGVSPEIKRKELYEEAENVRKEIQSLEEELKNGN